MEHPLISIVIPVYNVAAYLASCVRSVLDQDYSHFELLLVDDGSTDSCGKLCDNLAALDRRIRVIHQENQGLSGARNRGLQEAQGAYILFLDGDDRWEAGLLSALVREAGEAYDLVLFPLKYVDETGQPLEAPRLEAGEFSGEALLEKLILEGNVQYVTAVNRLYKRKFWEGLRFPQGRFHEDEFVAHRIYEKTALARVLEAPAYLYLQRGGSITRQENPRRKLDRIDAFLDRSGRLASRPPLRSKAAGNALFWYLELLRENLLRDIRQERDFDVLRRALRQELLAAGLVPRSGQQLALMAPGLWQLLHPSKRKG